MAMIRHLLTVLLLAMLLGATPTFAADLCGVTAAENGDQGKIEAPTEEEPDCD